MRLIDVYNTYLYLVEQCNLLTYKPQLELLRDKIELNRLWVQYKQEELTKLNKTKNVNIININKYNTNKAA